MINKYDLSNLQKLPMEIPKPKLNSHNKSIYSRLQSHGWEIKWQLDPGLAGNASSQPVEQIINFREPKNAVDQSIISHELLHFDLYDKGYPIITNKFRLNKFSILMLNDIFQHILIEPILQKLKIYLKKQESPGIIKLISNLTTQLKMESLEDKELFTTILYIRAYCININTEKFDQLEKYIITNNKTFTIKKIKEIIQNRLPDHNTNSIEYKKRLNETLFALNMQNEVNWLQKDISSKS